MPRQKKKKKPTEYLKINVTVLYTLNRARHDYLQCETL